MHTSQVTRTPHTSYTPYTHPTSHTTRTPRALAYLPCASHTYQATFMYLPRAQDTYHAPRAPHILACAPHILSIPHTYHAPHIHTTRPSHTYHAPSTHFTRSCLHVKSVISGSLPSHCLRSHTRMCEGARLSPPGQAASSCAVGSPRRQAGGDAAGPHPALPVPCGHSPQGPCSRARVSEEHICL